MLRDSRYKPWTDVLGKSNRKIREYVLLSELCNVKRSVKFLLPIRNISLKQMQTADDAIKNKCSIFHFFLLQLFVLNT